VTGLAKLEYRPEAEFMRLLVAACIMRHFEGFNPQDLANVINGDHMCTAKGRVDWRLYRPYTCAWQAWRSLSTSRGTSS
jgi:hypothetical protein